MWAARASKEPVFLQVCVQAGDPQPPEEPTRSRCAGLAPSTPGCQGLSRVPSLWVTHVPQFQSSSHEPPPHSCPLGCGAL